MYDSICSTPANCGSLNYTSLQGYNEKFQKVQKGKNKLKLELGIENRVYQTIAIIPSFV